MILQGAQISNVFLVHVPLHLVTRLFEGRQRARFGATAAAIAAAIVVLPASMAAARGPENIADVAEQVIDAVVNISTSQKVDARMGNMPDLPPGSPMEEFFEEFFKNRRGAGRTGRRRPRRRGASIRSAPASSSMRRASSSPTIT